MPTETKHFYGFGPFRVDTARRLLLRGEEPLALTPKAFDTLLVLVQNGERLVTKDELMKALWPDSFVEEANLTQNIFMLRKALGESPSEHRYIVTVPGRGYRFAAKVSEYLEGDDRAFGLQGQASAASPGQGKEQQERAPAGVRGVSEEYRDIRVISRPAEQAAVSLSVPRRVRGWPLAAGGAALVVGLVTLAAVRLMSPLPSPRLLRITQLTHIGRVEPSTRILTDGARLYFSARAGGQWNLMQVSIEGGEPLPVLMPFGNMAAYDISPDHSNFLMGSRALEEDRPLWTVPLLGGSPRRIGDVLAHDAVWSADGGKIVYARGSDVYLMNSDGTGSRKLAASTWGMPLGMRWCPSGRVLRFSVSEPDTAWASLWEVQPDGSNLHRLNLGPSAAPTGWSDGDCCPAWTPDGRYFLFRSSRNDATSVWAVAQKSGFWRPTDPTPVQLATGTSYIWWCLLPSPDGKRIFFPSGRDQRELVRYDFRLEQFVPYLSGIPARWVNFSRDGQWVSYVKLPGWGLEVLWRSRVDGSQPLQLSFPPLHVTNSSWSPDGKRIAFEAQSAGKPQGIYVISVDGSGLERLLPAEDRDSGPNWSPDGNSLIFQRSSPPEVGQPLKTWFYQLDLGTRELRRVPGSEGLIWPSWSPDGRYLAAQSQDHQKVMLFDFRSQHWREVASGRELFGLHWTRDSGYLYFQDLFEGRKQPIFRLRISDGKIGRVTTSERFLRADVTAYSLAGLTPDGSPLASLIRYNDDIYALEVELP
jgi:DNA-binding winged helix-turn-helix (wHTH) protein/Tol biopolymer transport system component